MPYSKQIYRPCEKLNQCINKLTKNKYEAAKDPLRLKNKQK